MPLVQLLSFLLRSALSVTKGTMPPAPCYGAQNAVRYFLPTVAPAAATAIAPALLFHHCLRLFALLLAFLLFSLVARSRAIED